MSPIDFFLCRRRLQDSANIQKEQTLHNGLSTVPVSLLDWPGPASLLPNRRLTGHLVNTPCLFRQQWIQATTSIQGRQVIVATHMGVTNEYLRYSATLGDPHHFLA